MPTTVGKGPVGRVPQVIRRLSAMGFSGHRRGFRTLPLSLLLGLFALAGRTTGDMLGSDEGRLEAAWRTLLRGDPIAAAGLVRESFPGQPEDPRAGRLAEMFNRLDFTADDPDIRVHEPIFPAGYRLERGRHILLVDRDSDGGASGRVAFLERVLLLYYCKFAVMGFDLRIPAERIVVVRFSSRDEYLDFLRKEGAAEFGTTTGYYHPTRGIVATYSVAEDDPSRRGGSRSWPRRAGATPPGAISAQDVELGSAAHELIHLLTGRSGLAPTLESFPRWLHEGIAQQFEVVHGGDWAGAGPPHDLRLADWRDLDPRPSLGALLRDEGLSHGYRAGRYAAAWALVYFLEKEHPAEFSRYLDYLRTPGATSRLSSSAAFDEVFGVDRTEFQTRWHAYIGRLAADRR